jgi:hypothetical protein
VIPVRFTLAEFETANDAWGANCGPGALAAICGRPLDEVRQHLGSNWPGYTNPTAMRRALESMGCRFKVERCDHPFLESGKEWPRWGLARIQWEGPWTDPGASPRWAYRHTHWVGSSQGTGSRGQPLTDVWDVNTLGSIGGFEDGWSPLEWWSSDIVPRLTRDIPRATGGWHITHSIEVTR